MEEQEVKHGQHIEHAKIKFQEVEVTHGDTVEALKSKFQELEKTKADYESRTIQQAAELTGKVQQLWKLWGRFQESNSTFEPPPGFTSSDNPAYPNTGQNDGFHYRYK